MTKSMREVELLSGRSKAIEREIVQFYKTVGRMVNLNSRATEIFAYLRIYDALTQEQLKQLTGFSLSTVSSVLQSFLQSDIVSRRMIPKTHKNLYRIKRERVKFDYNPPRRILEELEALDLYIVDKQTELQRLHKSLPIETEFLHRRLNSLRNYIEVQRRQISRAVRHTFFEEDVSGIVPRNEMISYPFDTRDLEEDLLGFLTHLKNDPMRARVLTIFFTRRSLDQQALMELSGFSRSTVSRLLRRELKTEYVRVLPREYRKPAIYYMDSISSSILSLVLKADDFIFSYAPRLQEILSAVESGTQYDKRDVPFLMTRLRDILEQIEAFRRHTKPIGLAYRELLELLENNGS